MVFHALQGNLRAIPCGSARYTMRELGMKKKTSLPETLANFRKSAKLSQEALADLAGIGRSTLQDIERGLSSPAVDTLQSIADALKIPITEFFPKPKSKTELNYEDAFLLIHSYRNAVPLQRAFALAILTKDFSHLEPFPDPVPKLQSLGLFPEK